MKPLQQKIKEYFSFTKSELIGVFVLLFLILIILLVPLIIKSFNKNSKPDTKDFDNKLLQFQNKISNIQSAKNINSLNPDNIYQKPSLKYNKHQEDNFTVELNSADSLELMRLKGIGPAFAKKIMSYRRLLGGYAYKEQLLEVWGMDISRYNLFIEHIRVEPDSIHKININTAAFKSLMKHPYIKYDIARKIILYRKQHGNFNSIEELKKLELINDSIFNKLKLYVKVA